MVQGGSSKTKKNSNRHNQVKPPSALHNTNTNNTNSNSKHEDNKTLAHVLQGYYEKSLVNGVANSYTLQNYFPRPTSLPTTSHPGAKDNTFKDHNAKLHHINHTNNVPPIPALTSPIHGHTYFLAAKEEIKNMLGGTFDYGERYTELSKMIETKDLISLKWKHKEESGSNDLRSCFVSNIQNSGASISTQRYVSGRQSTLC